MQLIHPKQGEEPLQLLARCNGYYECPKDTDGTRLGPLVGYAGKYDDKHQYVGDVYVNFAKAERHAPVLQCIVHGIVNCADLFAHAGAFNKATGFCGAPEGGKALANALALYSGKQYIFPDKEVLAIKTETARQQDKLRFDRHEPEPGESWWIVEDVCNNFSTTKEMMDLIAFFGASVAGIICFLNRSTEVHHRYLSVPVIALVRKQFPQYKQDDPLVAGDVRAGNVVLKPKHEWHRLVAAATICRRGT